MKAAGNWVELAEQFFALCDDIVRRRLPPTSMLVRVAVYAFKQRQELTVFQIDPRVNIDNNPTENAIRPWALDAKIGSSSATSAAAKNPPSSPASWPPVKTTRSTSMPDSRTFSPDSAPPGMRQTLDVVVVPCFTQCKNYFC